MVTPPGGVATGPYNVASATEVKMRVSTTARNSGASLRTAGRILALLIFSSFCSGLPLSPAIAQGAATGPE